MREPSAPAPGPAPRVTIARRLEWDALHRIPGHEGACKAFHGHRYAAEIWCEADALDALGRVIDFSVIKSVVGAWIDQHWDHTGILMRTDPDPAIRAIAESNAGHGRPVYWMDHPPTAEYLALELLAVATRLLAPHAIRVVEVKLWETPNCSARAVSLSAPL